MRRAQRPAPVWADGGWRLAGIRTGLSPFGLVAAVWDRLRSLLTVPGSIGAWLSERLGLVTAGTVIVSTPVAVGGDVTTIQGDSYMAEDGRALEWTVDTTAELTGATIAVILHDGPALEAEYIGDSIVRLELTSEDSSSIAARRQSYSIVATQDDGDVITLARAFWGSAATRTQPGTSTHMRERSDMPVTLILGVLAVGALLGAADRAWTRRSYDNRRRPWRRSFRWQVGSRYRAWKAGWQDSLAKGGWR